MEALASMVNLALEDSDLGGSKWVIQLKFLILYNFKCTINYPLKANKLLVTVTIYYATFLALVVHLLSISNLNIFAWSCCYFAFNKRTMLTNVAYFF